MSRFGGHSTSGANTTPLGAPRGGAGGPGRSSLLNPEYLQKAHGDPSSASDSSLPFGNGGADEKKMQALQTILAFNAEQARKRAAQGGDSREGSGSRESSSAPRSRFSASNDDDDDDDRGRKRKRRSRWGGGEEDKTFIPGLPTMMPQGLNKAQEEAYLLQLKIEDCSRRLRTGDFGIPLNPEDRSPSPEPIYSSDGKRMNTREYRKRKELEETRHHSITHMLSINPDYKPPADYKPPQIKVNDKVMIPQEEYPEINFVGLLIGPRGNTLKAMERETGAKIIIRGKGSVKEGKVGRKDGQPLPGEDEPLHAYVTSNNPESVKKAVDKIKEIIKQGVDVPEGQNDLRRHQLRELALLNGTLREGEGPRCSNCGAMDHKSWQCQDKPNVTNNIVCSACGGAGHIAKDCQLKRPGANFEGGGFKNKMDDEYMTLMAELGQGPPPAAPPSGGPKPWQRSGGGGGGGGNVFRPSGPPRALMGPSGPRGGGPPPPPPGEYGVPPPPGTQDQFGGGGGGSGGQWGKQPPPWEAAHNWSQPPPPGQASQPPAPKGGASSWPPPAPPALPGAYGMPPPPFFNAPPPPPPSSAQASAAAAPPAGYWAGGGGWGGPVPPPPALQSLIAPPPPPPPPN